ncbi:thioredoxin TrxC [Aliarcobacter cibarius]|jgi:thioredoxin 2|uniref:Thioredoxin n=1 Tax=Aliarcobacter cibarius TaxID=255507 RepID=A0A5J6RGL7_9BACT|nr:thioredoxin TrxC [Aliarcobacter cibarius]MBP9490909.1 thioredoxin TrxC [Aliarcobacter sp.]QEZ89084.1 thioredoxin [Aliarcobacter cibarius]QKJ27103.1 thioredoxin [Aliarcobacter cibarius]TLT02632.1 thioredoxin TrxC [Aliarcobacter cibarius]
MSSLNVICPHCLKVNKIPQKDGYTKANCGSCKNSLLDTTPIEADENNIDHILANSDIPVIVDFWAPWCGPCKMFAPIFNQTAQKYPLKALFVKVNTEALPNLGARFQIRSIPTLVVFKSGLEKKRNSGALDPLRLTSFINEFI